MLSSFKDNFNSTEYGGLIESFITCYNDSHLKIDISKLKFIERNKKQ